MAEGMDDENLIQFPLEALQQMFEQLGGLPPVAPIPIVQRPDEWHPDRIQFSISSYGPSCVARILSDLRNLMPEERRPGADVFPNENDTSRIDYLIRGQPDTPYEGGFFHFAVRAPPEYPEKPPRVALITTGRGTVRFNPNFYENGCVCLSILGTWLGNAWEPTHTLANVLHSLQARFNEMPWDNEPEFDQNQLREWKQLYSDFLSHETLRVAVCDQLDPMRSPLPDEMRRRAAKHFVRDFERYVARCNELRHRLDGKPMMNPYQPWVRNRPFNFEQIGQRIRSLLDSARRDAEADAAAEAADD
ncbi:hypothetical protein BOX15_Mlig027437g1 [Macrostomum lignano]|uniref:Ubiquitin-conjugating enzyme E2 Z n=1 Tax=Macrostomum lignano TaxID=282301 RepID=A0A267F453_9PLAT|nr:hypothetical protein BOX15_Mlig027437g1 [Macrostomum lignano]